MKKLIINIPEYILDTIQADEMISREQLAILQIHILNGTPLDDVKAEILQLDYDIDFVEYDYNDMPMTEEIHTICREEVMQILDNIGKKEDES